MKKRKMVSWILAVSVAGMLAGCGSSTTSNNAGTTAAAETKQKTLLIRERKVLLS